MKNQVISLTLFLLVMSGTFVVGRTLTSSRPDMPELNAPTLEKPSVPTDHPQLVLAPADLINELEHGNVQPLDVRSEALYASGHIPGALRVAVDADCITRGIDCVRSELGRQGLDGREDVVLYGGAEDALEIGRLFWLLEWAGFEQVRVLDGGLPAWSRAAGALETAGRVASARALTVEPNDSAVADVYWMSDYFGLAGIEVLDLRDEGLWMDNGYEPPTHFSAGHVPYSLPYDFRGWVSEGQVSEGQVSEGQVSEGHWPEPASAWDELLRLGARPDSFINPHSEFAVYGDGPHNEQLGLAYFLLRRMGVEVRVFAEGWQAWSEGAERPVVRIVEASDLAQQLEAENPGLMSDELASSTVVFDLREVLDFYSEHVPGSFNIPANYLDEHLESVLAKHWPDLRREEVPIVFYCYGRPCIRSREASNLAARSGFREIWWFRDALATWNQWPLARTEVDEATDG